MEKNLEANTAKPVWQLRQRRAPRFHYYDVIQEHNSQMLISFIEENGYVELFFYIFCHCSFGVGTRNLKLGHLGVKSI